MRFHRRLRQTEFRSWAGTLLRAGMLMTAISGCVVSNPSFSELGSRLESKLATLKSDGDYNYNTFLVDGKKVTLDRILRSMFILKVIAEFEMSNGQVVHTASQATGVVLFDRYVLTVDHAVSNYTLELKSTRGENLTPVRRRKQETFIFVNGTPHRLHDLLRDRHTDVALFRLPDGLELPSFPYEIGNSDELLVGHFIYVVGNPMNMGFNVREGIVSTVRAPERLSVISAVPANAFMVSNGLNPGYSGTPAIAIRDGQFELVGLTQGTFLTGQHLGWVIRINSILEKIRPYIDRIRTARPQPPLNHQPFQPLFERVFDPVV